MDRFVDAGIPNLRVNYAGWFNDGILHNAPESINLISALGGTRGFNDLIRRAEARNVDLFFEADFTFINNDSLFNGYNVNRDTAKRISRDLALIYPYSFVWFGERTGSYGRRYSFYLANPQYTMRAIDSFHSDLTALGARNITFGSIGRSINSDFNVNNLVTRKEVRLMQQEKMAELQAAGAKLMIHGGFIYAIPYVDFLTSMELEANNPNIVDECIPFYQIVLHGLVPYTGVPVNLSPDFNHSILKAVETGAGLSFMFMNASGERLLDTHHTRFFSADINRWGDRPIELYHRLNNELGHTANLFITGHRKPAPFITVTEYEDGTQVIVNYSDEAFVYYGLEVKSKDFAVKR
jgi:hypothetical protein